MLFCRLRHIGTQFVRCEVLVLWIAGCRSESCWKLEPGSWKVRRIYAKTPTRTWSWSSPKKWRRQEKACGGVRGCEKDSTILFGFRYIKHLLSTCLLRIYFRNFQKTLTSSIELCYFNLDENSLFLKYQSPLKEGLSELVSVPLYQETCNMRIGDKPIEYDPDSGKHYHNLLLPGCSLQGQYIS